jgi:cell division protein FtsZ
MIEFTPDGPFSEKADELFPGRVRILGLGQTGAAVCDQLVLHGRPGLDLWVFDSDQLIIEGSVVPHRQLLGHPLVHGLGCSGDIELAREIVALEEKQLTPVSRGCDFLILVVGLAGSTGIALAERMIELGHEAGAKVIVVGVQPFAFEGWARRERSIEAIATLRAEADSVLVLSHDRIAENPVTIKNIRHGFHLMHQMLAETTQALAQIVCKRGLIQLSFADVRSLYGRYTGSEVLENCWAAHVEGDIHDRTEDLITELLSKPLLSDDSIWKHVDHAIIAVSGTRDLGLSDVQEMVSAFKDRLPVNIPIVTSASLDDENNEAVRMTVLLATTAPARMSLPELAAAIEIPPVKKPRPLAETTQLPNLKLKPKAKPEPVVAAVPPPAAVPAPVKKPKPTQKPVTAFVPPPPPPVPEPVTVENVTIEEEEIVPALEINPEPPVPAPVAPSARTSRRFTAKQEEMSFEGPPRGRFEKTLETMYRGENLDQPTYRRRGLTIKV